MLLSNPWISIRHNCLSALSDPSFYRYWHRLNSFGAMWRLKGKKKVTLLVCGWVLVSLSFLFFLSLTVSQLAEMHVNMVKVRLGVAACGEKGQKKAACDTNTSSRALWQRMVATYLPPTSTILFQSLFHSSHFWALHSESSNFSISASLIPFASVIFLFFFCPTEARIRLQCPLDAPPSTCI